MAKKETKTNKKENTKNKRSFWKDFKAELKKVVWPTPKQLVNNTIAVVTIVLITAAIVFVLDVGFESINKFATNKVKDLVESTNSTSEEATTNEDSSEDVVEESTDEATEVESTESENQAE